MGTRGFIGFVLGNRGRHRQAGAAVPFFFTKRDSRDARTTVRSLFSALPSNVYSKVLEKKELQQSYVKPSKRSRVAFVRGTRTSFFLAPPTPRETLGVHQRCLQVLRRPRKSIRSCTPRKVVRSAAGVWDRGSAMEARLGQF